MQRSCGDMTRYYSDLAPQDGLINPPDWSETPFHADIRRILLMTPPPANRP